MKSQLKTVFNLKQSFFLAVLVTFAGTSFGANLSPLIDDFSDVSNNSLGNPRQLLNDTLSGGKTTVQHNVAEGVMLIKGNIVPPRGQPGWASTVLLLDAKGLPKDASAFEGIRLRVKIHSGNISISANSSKVTNYDYHAAPVVVASDGEFHEVKIPFTAMKRAWSEQTSLDTETINSLSIVAYDMQQGAFEFEVDEVSFY